MPTGKDLKRLVRARMEKTGESYTAARAQLLNRRVASNVRNVRLKADATNVNRSHVNRSNVSPRDYAKLAGTSDASLKAATGCTWERWVKTLDKAGAANMSHREIAKVVAFFKTPSWWTQTVTVGYERIRGLRERGQQRNGAYQTTKSRTVNVPLSRLFGAFTDQRTRARWLDANATIKSVSPNKRIRLVWDDGTAAIAGFYARGTGKSMVAVEHTRLPSKAAADAMKKKWGESLDRLASLVGVAV
jgi:uncharacterized protein YndB with AHSA1/START domain